MDQIYKDLTAACKSSLDAEKVKSLVSVFDDPYDAATGTHAIVILTEWDSFKVSNESCIHSLPLFLIQ